MRRAVSVAIGGACAVLIVFGPVSAAQQTLPNVSPLEFNRVIEWAKAVRTHRPGIADPEAVAMARWTPAELYMLFGELRALSAFKHNPRVSTRALNGYKYPGAQFKDQIVGLLDLGMDVPDNVNRLLKRAALLHTDVAMLQAPFAITGVASPFSGRSTMRVLDGREIGETATATHLEFASWLLDGVATDPSGDPHVRAWYETACAVVLRKHWFGDAEWLLSRAEARFPDDAVILFYLGTLHEAFAAPSYLEAMQAEPGVKPRAIPGQERLELAAAQFQRALTISPDFAEARLHLGRVLGQLGQEAPAIEELVRASAGLTDRALQYFAGLFLGNELALTGDQDGARQSFERAHALYPLAQSPLLALSELARRYGDSAGAVAALQQLLALPASPTAREDPWWSYVHSQVMDAEARLSAWRTIIHETTR